MRELRGLGLSPDIIVCRSEKPIDQSVKDKISNFCHVAPDQVRTLREVLSLFKHNFFRLGCYVQCLHVALLQKLNYLHLRNLFFNADMF